MNNAPWASIFPADWRRVRLKNLVASVSAGVWGDEPTDDEGVACIRAADFDRQHLRVSLAKVPLRKMGSEQFRACALAPGDLVLEKSGGGDQQPVGAVVMFDHDTPAVPTNFAARIRPTPTVDARFLCYVFATTYTLRLNVRSIKQTTGLQNLDVGAYLAEGWAVPPLSHQVRIADFLDRETARIDAVISAKGRVLELMRVRARACADELLRSEPHPVARVKAVIRRITSGPRGWASYFSEAGRPFLRISNVLRDRLEVSDYDLIRVNPPDGAEAERTRTEEGDVVVSITADVGSVGVVSTQFAGGHVSQHLALLRPVKDRIEPRWLALALFGSEGQAQLDSARYGGTKTQLSLDDVAEVWLPLPPLDHQQAILARWSQMESAAERLGRVIESQIGLLRERRQALIATAVAGQIDVPRG